MIEIDEGVCGPKGSLQFVPGNDLSRSLQQCFENLKGLLLQSDPQPVLAQFSGPKIDLEDAKADGCGTMLHRSHAAGVYHQIDLGRNPSGDNSQNPPSYLQLSRGGTFLAKRTGRPLLQSSTCVTLRTPSQCSGGLWQQF